MGWIFGPCFAVLAWRQWNLGAHVGERGVKLVSYLLSTRVPWRDIDRFEVRPWYRYPCIGHLVKCNGRALPITGIGASRRHRGAAQAVVDELNDALRERRLATEPPSYLARPAA